MNIIKLLTFVYSDIRKYSFLYLYVFLLAFLSVYMPNKC